MVARLGDIQFEARLSPTGMDRERSVNYAEHELINDVPRLQKVSLRNLRTFSISFHFAAQFCDPDAEMDRLEQLMNDGTVLPLVQGNGKSLGSYVITRITDNPTRLHPTDGITLDTNVTIELKEYVEPKTIATKATGFAVTSSSPNLVPLVPRSQGITAMIQSDQREAVMQGLAADKALKNANGQPLKEARFMASAKKAVSKVQAAHKKLDEGFTKFSQKLLDAQNSTATALQSIQNAQQRVIRARNALQAAQRAAQNAALAIQSGDISGAINASRDLTNAHNRLRGANSETAYLTGARKTWGTYYG